MTKRQRRRNQLQKYIEKVQPLMNLAHWSIYVSEEAPNSKTASLSVWVANNQTEALIRFADTHWDQTPERRRYEVAHELVHCILAPLTQAADDDRLDPIHLVHSEEWVTDHLARLICQGLPLPK